MDKPTIVLKPKKVKSIPPQFRDKSKPALNVKSMIDAYEQNIIPPPPQFRDKPTPAPRKNVKSMIDAYEQNIISPPPQFRDKPTPAPRTKIKQLDKPTPAPRTKIKQIDQALKGYTKSYEISIKNDKDPLLQLQNTRKFVAFHISSILTSMKGLKFVEALKVTLTKISFGETINKTVNFFSQSQTIINDMDIDESLEASKQKILNKIAVWMSEGSGWTVESVDNHYLNVVKYAPLTGSSYIKMPKDLRNRSLINIKNYDNECFRWCHIRHLNPQKKNPQRIKTVDKQYIKNLNYSGIKFPVTIKQYNKIEKQNNININVVSYCNKEIFPIYSSQERNKDELNLLLLTKTEGCHYILIKDFDTFMHNITKHSGKKYFCMFCLQHFSSERILTDHKENCIIINGTQGITMPTKRNNILKFNGFNKQLPVPFVIYADFEAITEKIDSCQCNDNKSYTEAYQNHLDCGYGYKVVCCYDDKYTKEEEIYRGEKAVYRFMEAMLKEVRYCKNVIKTEFDKPLKMTKDDEENFQKADRCHICEQKYNEKDVRVRDHCHITGKYRGSAHQDCNLKFQLTDKIPVIFHNLRGYDSHFIIQEIGAITKKHT